MLFARIAKPVLNIAEMEYIINQRPLLRLSDTPKVALTIATAVATNAPRAQ